MHAGVARYKATSALKANPNPPSGQHIDAESLLWIFVDLYLLHLRAKAGKDDLEQLERQKELEDLLHRLGDHQGNVRSTGKILAARKLLTVRDGG